MNRGKAVAVTYDESLPAPFISASGEGELALAIERIASEHGVRIISSPDLADSLVKLDVGSFVPEEYYGIMAEILAFVRKLKER